MRLCRFKRGHAHRSRAQRFDWLCRSVVHIGTSSAFSPLKSQGFESPRSGMSTSILSMPHADIGRFAHLWSTQRFGLFWDCDIHNPSGKTNLRAEFDYPHPLDAQAFEFFGASISTRHPNSRGCSRTESHRPIDSRKAPTDKAFRPIRPIEGRTLTGQVHRDSTGWCAGCPHAVKKRVDIPPAIASRKTCDRQPSVQSFLHVSGLACLDPD